jgi:shikimate kinase
MVPREMDRRKPVQRKRSAQGPAKTIGAGVRNRRDRATSRQPGTRAVVLIGFMGAGKSSVGRALSEQLGWAFEDLDQRIEQRQRRTVPEIFRVFGETGFRLAELSALKELLNELDAGAEKIVALGGGAFVQEHNARLIEAANIPTVFLDADVEELWRRCRDQALQQRTERPLLGSLESFRDLYEARRPHYLKASLRHETGGKSVAEIAAELVQALGLKRKLARGRGRRGEK